MAVHVSRRRNWLGSYSFGGGGAAGRAAAAALAMAGVAGLAVAGGAEGLAATTGFAALGAGGAAVVLPGLVAPGAPAAGLSEGDPAFIVSSAGFGAPLPPAAAGGFGGTGAVGSSGFGIRLALHC